ncbi:hypothetical protein [Cryobacterium sp. BB736]|uniref:hypothetical protein n=1 Tax=Cryobacterium sp. BB736 TaxID=2746963 RepID=UPI001875F387|nr:hypothetical protein [Cryobacterium sp. BB736]
MIDWFAYVQVAIAVLAGLFCLVRGFMGRKPDDFTLGATTVVEVLLLVQLVVALLAPGFGNVPSGNVLEFYTYLVSAIILLPLAGLWSLIERNKWSNIVLAIANLAVAVMVYRMLQIWSFQLA